MDIFANSWEVTYRTGLRDYQESLLQAFLDQEALMLYSRENHVRLFHAWRHERGFLAGSRDASLAVWDNMVLSLRNDGFYVLVRPFGGLAIPVDFGVLNVTLIIPGEPSLDEAFDQLAQWLIQSLAAYGKVIIGEVAGSYCPGRYDLSLHGEKIAGLAQRRAKGVVAVSAFINLYPATYARAKLVQDLYLREQQFLTTQHSWLPNIHTSTISDLVTICHDQQLYDPHYLLSLLHSVHPLHDDGVNTEQMILRHYEEATHRLQTQRNLKEWIPFQ